jgi:hypothetical protein
MVDRRRGVRQDDGEVAGQGRQLDLSSRHGAEDEACDPPILHRVEHSVESLGVVTRLGDEHGVLLLLGDVEQPADHRGSVAGESDIVGDEADRRGGSDPQSASGRVGTVVQPPRDRADPLRGLGRQPGARPVVEDHADGGLGETRLCGHVGDGHAFHRSPPPGLVLDRRCCTNPIIVLASGELNAFSEHLNAFSNPAGRVGSRPVITSNGG